METYRAECFSARNTTCGPIWIVPAGTGYCGRFGRQGANKVGEDFILNEGDLTDIIDPDITSEGEDDGVIAMQQEEDRGGTAMETVNVNTKPTEAGETVEHEP